MFNGIGDIVFFALIAVFIAYRLHTTLGRKDFNNDEKIKHLKQLKEEDVVRFRQESLDEGNVVVELSQNPAEPKDEVLEAITNKTTRAAVEKIRKHNVSFTLKAFLQQAKSAFEMILVAFNEGNKEALATLLTPELQKVFDQEIDRRQKAQEFHEITIVSFLEESIKTVKLVKNTASITVQLKTEQINLVRNTKDDIIEGNPSVTEKVTDTWTFEKDVTSNDPRWLLVKTG